MTIEDSRKIAQAMQKGVFQKLTLFEQLKIQMRIRKKEINSYTDFINYLQEG